jgi:hypothetical protein
VNWTGLSAYNKFNTWLGLNPLLTGNTTDWLRNSYNALVNVAPSKPMMLAEWASIEAGDGGTKKAAWIKEALVNQIPWKFPQVKAIIYFNWATGGATYPIQSSQAATDAWAAAIGSYRYASNQFAKLGNSPIAPLSALSTVSTAEATPETLTTNPDVHLLDSMEVDDTPTESQEPEMPFSDVPPDHPAAPFIEQLYAAGLIDACGTEPLQFCPDGLVTRAQFAVILERALHGATYVPPEVKASTGFSDVPPKYPEAPFIVQFAQDGMAASCNGRKYCPDAPVTRAEAARFLLRFKYGADYTPPGLEDGTGFEDVPPDHWAATWIKQFVAEGIATGCGEGNYCPDTPVTRADLAVYMERTLNLP